MDDRQAAPGKIQPVYVLFGTEQYLMEEWIDQLVRNIVQPGTEDFAYSKYDLTETPLLQVMEDAETIPFLVPRKLIIASGAYFLTAGRGASKSAVEHHVNLLEAYVSQPAEHSVLVLTVPAEKLDERKKIVKLLKKEAAVLSFEPLGPKELLRWLGKRASLFGVSLEADAAEALADRVGGNCSTLASELEKLALYVGQGGTIRREMVEELAVRTSEQNVFQLVEAIVRLRPEQAMSILHDLLKEKEEPIKLLALIARQFRMILGTQELSRQGYSISQIASQLGAHPYAIKKASEQGRRFKPETLGKILKELADLDVQMKTGAVDKTIGLEMFILRLAQAAAG